MGRSGPPTIYCATDGPRFKLPPWRNLASRMSIGDGCWEWHGLIGKNGYAKYANTEVHRLMWAHKHGPVAPGLAVCHKCDNPRCVRVDHLFVGTQADNIRDMAKKGRAKFGFHGVTHSGRGYNKGGAGHWRATFSEEEVRAIRESPLKTKHLAELLGVPYHTVWRVRRRTRYKNVV